MDYPPAAIARRRPSVLLQQWGNGQLVQTAHADLQGHTKDNLDLMVRRQDP